MIRLREVEKSVPAGGGRHWLLRQIDLDVSEGEFVTVMGPSGAGKSTLLSILGLLDADWTGEYLLHGEPVHRLPPKRRQALARHEIGFVFQQYHLLDDLTVAENLAVPLDYRGVKPAERQALVADALDRFGIVGKKDLFPRQLSGGQQQLVGVARAVIGRPKLLLADEPTAALDDAAAATVVELLGKAASYGATLVVATHDVRLKPGFEKTLNL
jgi:ABC-type lipoprotein export system ATPase subunit